MAEVSRFELSVRNTKPIRPNRSEYIHSVRCNLLDTLSLFFATLQYALNAQSVCVCSNEHRMKWLEFDLD